MTPLLLALLVFVIAGGAASMWLHQHGNPVAAAPAVRERDESQLADLRWRDFTRLMLQAMKGTMVLERMGGIIASGQGERKEGGGLYRGKGRPAAPRVNAGRESRP